MREIEIRIGRNAAKEIGEWFGRPENWDKEPREVIYIESISMLSAIFSPAKLRLLNELGKKKGASVNEIAKKLKRPREAISRDLHLLAEKGLVGFERKGKRAMPRILVEKICIPIATKENAID